MRSTAWERTVELNDPYDDSIPPVSVILTENLCRRYGGRVGIDSVTLNVPEGQVFGFLGPNGAGKTTTIRILLGLLRPTSGIARVFGMDSWRKSHQIKEDLGYLPGDLRLYPWLTARSAVRMAGRIRGLNLDSPGRELWERFRLDPDVQVRRMSRGMRQKVGIVLALAHRPRVLVLDEPTTGLDPLIRDELASYLRELAAEGHTVFFSSHTLSEVEQLCDWIAIVRDGRIVADEGLESLRNRARRSVSIEFRDAKSATEAVPPDSLNVLQRSGASWQCELVGAAPPMVAWAARQEIVDITIGRPNLESLFHSFYRDRQEAS